MFFSLLSGPPSGKDPAKLLFKQQFSGKHLFCQENKETFIFKVTASNAPFSRYATTYSGLTYPYKLMMIMMWHVR